MADPINEPKNTPDLGVQQTPSSVVSTDGTKPGFMATSTEGLGDDTSEGAPYATIGDKTFKDQAELSAWYDAQQAERLAAEDGEVGDGDDPKDDPDVTAPKDEPVARTDDEIRASLKAAGGIYADERYEAAALEFEKNAGVVSPETIAKAAADFGVPEDYVTAFIDNAKTAREASAALAASQAALSEGALTAEELKTQGEFHEIAGGKAAFEKFTEWAAGGLKAPELAAYNKALEADDPSTAKVLLETFMERYKASGDGPRPRDITQQASTQPTEQAASEYTQEMMVKDMSDPRYKTDAKFQQEVARKVGAMRD